MASLAKSLRTVRARHTILAPLLLALLCRRLEANKVSVCKRSGTYGRLETEQLGREESSECPPDCLQMIQFVGGPAACADPGCEPCPACQSENSEEPEDAASIEDPCSDRKLFESICSDPGIHSIHRTIEEGDKIYREEVVYPREAISQWQLSILPMFKQYAAACKQGACSAPRSVDEVVAIVDKQLQQRIKPLPAISNAYRDEVRKVNADVLLSTLWFDTTTHETLVTTDTKEALRRKAEELGLGVDALTGFHKKIEKGWTLKEVAGLSIDALRNKGWVVCSEKVCRMDNTTMKWKEDPEQDFLQAGKALFKFEGLDKEASLETKFSKAYHSLLRAAQEDDLKFLGSIEETLQNLMAHAEQVEKKAQERENHWDAEFKNFEPTIQAMITEAKDAYKENLPTSMDDPDTKRGVLDRLLGAFQVGIEVEDRDENRELVGKFIQFKLAPTGFTSTGDSTVNGVGTRFLSLSLGEVLPLMRAESGGAEYLKFSIAHEMGHNLEFPNASPDLAEANFRVLAQVREQVRLAWGGDGESKLQHGGAEIWADWLAAGTLLKKMDAEAIKKALNPFCKFGEGKVGEDNGPDGEHPPPHPRVLINAKHQHVFPKLCSNRALVALMPADEAKCIDGCGTGCPTFKNGKEWCSFSLSGH